MGVFDVLGKLKDGGTFLLNTQYTKDEVWNQLPKRAQKQIIDIPNAFIVPDNLEYGYRNRIPLWLFGFLY